MAVNPEAMSEGMTAILKHYSSTKRKPLQGILLKGSRFLVQEQRAFAAYEKRKQKKKTTKEPNNERAEAELRKSERRNYKDYGGK